MSCVLSAGLQAAIFARLGGDAAIAALVGGAVYDAPPPLAPADTDYLLIGEEVVRGWGSKTSDGAIHDFSVTVYSGRSGFDWAKRVAAAVSDALVDAPLPVVGGRVVALRFLRASAERGRAPERRRVVLRFRAVLEHD